MGGDPGGRPQPAGHVRQVLISQTVKDLVAGSGFSFADRGVAHLKGVPGEWRLYAAAG